MAQKATLESEDQCPGGREKGVVLDDVSRSRRVRPRRAVGGDHVGVEVVEWRFRAAGRAAACDEWG